MRRDHWDAATYDRVSDPQRAWGGKVLDRLELAGNEVVLDAGCGTGRVTEELAARLPRGRVVALDRSPAMAALARRRLPPDGCSTVVADLAGPLPFAPGSFDAVVSTATFHWVPGHRRLFAELGGVLRPGGQLVVQCGGPGNIASVTAVLREIGAGDRAGPWTFTSPDEAEGALRAAGFGTHRCWLNAEDTAFPSAEALAEFLRTVVLWPYTERLPELERAGFVAEVVGRLPGLVLDYVRLNIVARMPSGDGAGPPVAVRGGRYH